MAKRKYTRRKTKYTETRAYKLNDDNTISIFSPTTNKIQVNESTALNFVAVWASVRKIATVLASFPIFIYEDLDGEKNKTKDHPLYPILHDIPNTEMTSILFWETLTSHILLWGNAYAQILRNNSGTVLGLYPLLPGNMLPKRIKNSQLQTMGLFSATREAKPEATTIIYEYSYSNDAGSGKAYLLPEDILHIPGLSYDGIVGYSPITCAKKAIELGMSAEEFGTDYFNSGAMPPYILSHPQVLGKEGVKYLSDYIKNKAENREPVILEEGMTISPLTMNGKDAQFLESRNFSTSQIASFFGLFGSDIGGDNPSNTYSNLEASKKDFLQRAITPYVERIEQEINRKLFYGTNFYAEFSTDAYLRGSTIERYQAYQLADWMTADEKRALENLPPLPKEEPKEEEVNIRKILEPILLETFRRLATVEKNAYARADKDEQYKQEKIDAFKHGYQDTLKQALQPMTPDVNIDKYIQWHLKHIEENQETKTNKFIELMGIK